MRVLATVFLVLGLGLNALANRLPLNGKTTGELSAQYPNLFVPAGVTFSIWGVIYLLLLAWAVVQFLPSGAATGRRIAPWFAASCLLNGGWLLAWHYEYVAVSVVVMLLLLAVLVRINVLLLRPGSGGDPGTGVLPRAAFGVYLGWICIATIANVTALLVASGWEGAPLTATFWATVMVGVGSGVAAFAQVQLRNPFLGAAVAWALVGIVLNRQDDVALIAWAAGLCAVGVILVALWSYSSSSQTSPG